MRIVIPGGSGQVGSILARHLSSAGNAVTVLSRNPHPAPWQTLAWDAHAPGPWVDSLEGADVCINLTGRSVDCRYNQRNRRLIHDSRTDSTRLLNQVIASLRNPPRVWLNAATATIYRHTLDGPADHPQDEPTGELGGNEPGAPDTWNFSIQVAKDWEAAFFETDTPRTRKVALRSAMTFSPDRGGVFDVFLKLVRFGLGGTQGDGNQFVSWIHEIDLARAVDLLIAPGSEDSEHLSGPIILASPNPLPNREFMRVLRNAWGTRIGLPSARWMIEVGTFLLRTESELVLKSRRVVPTRLLQAGFTFHYPAWPEAARDLVQRWIVQNRR